MKRELDQRQYLETRIDQSTFKIFNSIAEADAADRAYWHSRTPQLSTTGTLGRPTTLMSGLRRTGKTPIES
jgi:hypothetical protein